MRAACLHRWLAFLVVCLVAGDPVAQDPNIKGERAQNGRRPPGESLSVGLLAQGVFWKGLFRDVEIVSWGLSRSQTRSSRILGIVSSS